jgi:transcriptional regulator with XRE-family HTH domain
VEPVREKPIYNAQYRELVSSLKDTRKRLGLTQAQVAARMGCSRTKIAKLECCEIGLNLAGLVRICRVYGLRPGKVIEMMG